MSLSDAKFESTSTKEMPLRGVSVYLTTVTCYAAILSSCLSRKQLISFDVYKKELFWEQN